MSIEINHLEHTYNAGTPFAHQALKGIDLSIPEGKVTAIIGQTGSGKSTLVQNIAANTDSVRVESPSGKISYLDNNLPTGEVLLDETGTYKIITTTAGTSRTYRIYSAFPIEESNTTQTGTAFLLTGEKTDEGYDGVYDDLLILVIILAVLFLADWVVYCYEQYQLR